MSNEKNNNNNKRETAAAKRVVKYNEKFNVPEQTEEEEAEPHENAPAEHLADEEEIKRRKAK
jgi:hypothetical protein